MKKHNVHRSSLLFLIAFFSVGLAQAKNYTVQMKSISYEPKKIQIKVGDTVQWQNVAYTDHSATADDASVLETGLVQPQKKSKAIAFNQEGHYVYHCSIHGKTMTGEVDVTK